VLGQDERLLAFDRIGIPYSSSLSQASRIKIGQELDADILVLGNFDSDGTQIKATTSILDLRKNVLKARLEEKAPLDQFQAACGRLAWKILAQLDSMFPLSLNAFLEKFPVIPNVALENYIRGLIESDRAKQIRYFRQAARRPNYSRLFIKLEGSITRNATTPHRHLAAAYANSKDMPEANFLIGLNHLHLKNYDKAVMSSNAAGDSV
jgi:hypothetical protein